MKRTKLLRSIRLSSIILVTMKLYIIAAFLLVALTVVLAAPVVEDSAVSDVHLRDKRATCQITGVIGEWVGDSACFAHCLWLKHIHGGHCSGGTCYCD